MNEAPEIPPERDDTRFTSRAEQKDERGLTTEQAKRLVAIDMDVAWALRSLEAWENGVPDVLIAEDLPKEIFEPGRR